MLQKYIISPYIQKVDIGMAYCVPVYLLYRCISA